MHSGRELCDIHCSRVCQLCKYLKMSIMYSSFSKLGRIIFSSSGIPAGNITVRSQLRLFSNWIVPRETAGHQIHRFGPLSSQAEGSSVFQQHPWSHQQVRTRKRGTEYQPSNIKRKRTHGWIKRLSSRGGIEVILRRMLKGRKSLSH